MTERVFVVDDEVEIVEIVAFNLRSEGYDVKEFTSGNALINDLLNETEFPQLIILDVMMEGINGFDVCNKLRSDNRFSHIPIIFLTAKSNENERIMGLESGGDDYITKPFAIKELLLRVNNVLKRNRPTHPHQNTIQYKNLTIHKESHQVAINNSPIKLTKTEYNLLLLFFENPKRYFTRDEILNHIRNDNNQITERAIDVHIQRLRKKLNQYKEAISTYSGVGYGFFPK